MGSSCRSSSRKYYGKRTRWGAGILDFGMVGAIDSETRVSIVKILLAALEKDASRVVAYIEEDILTVPIKSTVGLRLDLNEVLERYITADLKEMNLNNLVTDFFYILRKHNLKFPAHFVSILRALVVAEGTGMMLNPHFTIAPYLEKTLRRYASCYGLREC